MLIDLMAVQPYMTVTDYLSEEAFAAHMERLAAKAQSLRQHDHALIVFPEELATFLALSQAPPSVQDAETLDQAFSMIGWQSAWPLATTMMRHRVFNIPTAFFTLVAPWVYGIWYRTFSQMARRLKAVVVAGSALLPDNARGYQSDRFEARRAAVFNQSLTFGPDGNVLEVTKKRNLVPTQEDRLHLKAASTLPTPFAVGNSRAGTAICYDAFHLPHTDREPQFQPVVPALASQGAVIIAQPSANPWWWEQPWIFAKAGDTRLRREQWDDEGLMAAMVHEPRILAGVTAHLLAHIFDVHFDGQSVIYRRQAQQIQKIAQASRCDPHPESEMVIFSSLPF